MVQNSVINPRRYILLHKNKENGNQSTEQEDTHKTFMLKIIFRFFLRFSFPLRLT